MQKIGFFLFLIFVSSTIAQQSDFDNINFSKADKIANIVETKRLYELNKITYNLTNNLATDVEKARAIYVWICKNIANNFGLYSKNERKRQRYAKDSLKLANWNSKFKIILFKKLLKNKKTICTGYAYLMKEMCNMAGIEAKIVNGFGRTSAVDFEALTMPNHSWNVIKLNNKWYLCDPTWSAGISFPEEGRFEFIYNDGYFLTDPKLFIKNHFPLENQFTLLGDDSPSFTEFTELPLLYGAAYKILSKHIFPKKMHSTITKNDTFTFKYHLKKEIDLNTIKFLVYTGSNERTIKPKITLKENLLTLKHIFKRRGFYDLHLYINHKIIATYSFKIN